MQATEMESGESSSESSTSVSSASHNDDQGDFSGSEYTNDDSGYSSTEEMKPKQKKTTAQIRSEGFGWKWFDGKGVLFNPTPFRKQAVVPNTDPRKQLIIAPGEDINAFVDGSPAQHHIIILLLLLVFTLGCYQILHRKQHTAVLATDRRVIQHTRSYTKSGKLSYQAVTAFYIEHLVQGDNHYQSGRYTLWEKLLCFPLLRVIVCLSPKRKPQNKLDLHFFHYKQEDSSVLVQAEKHLLGRKQLNGVLSVACQDAELISVKKMTLLVRALLEKYPYSGEIKRKPVIDAVVDVPASWIDPEASRFPAFRRVVVNRQFIPLSNDERVVDGVWGRIEPVHLWEKLLTCVCGLFSAGCCWVLCCCCIRNSISRRQEAFVLTNNRLLSLSYYVAGTKGVKRITDSPMEFKFWLIRDVVDGDLAVKRDKCGCICYNESMSVKITVRPGGSITLTGNSDNMANLRSFVQSIISVDTPSLLSTVATRTLAGLNSDDVLLMENEKLIASITVKRGHSNLTRKKFLLTRLLTCCCYPRNSYGHLVLTSHRLIEMSTVKVPLTCRTVESRQQFWFLPAIKRAGIYSENACYGAFDFMGCSFCPVSLKLGIDADEVVRTDAFQVVFEFKAFGYQKENAQAFVAMLGMVHAPEQQQTIYNNFEQYLKTPESFPLKYDYEL
jgi:hypothetical protein